MDAAFQYVANEFDNGPVEEAAHMVAMFQQIVRATSERIVESVVVKKGKQSYKVYMDSEGCIRIQRTYKDVTEEEF